MGRGIFSGVIWGSAIAVMSLWLLSQLGGMVAVLSTPPQEVAVVAPEAGRTSPQVADDAIPTAPSAQSGPDTDPSRQGVPLQTANTDSAPQADRLPALVPQTSDAAVSPAEPVAGTSPGIASAIEDVTTVPAAVTPPMPPAVESLPELETTAPVPSVPDPADVDPVTPVAPQEDIIVAEATRVPEVAPSVGSEPEQPSTPVADQTPSTDFSQPVVVETPDVVIEEPEPESEPVPDTDTGTATPQEPPASGETLLQPAGELGGQVPNVRTNLLPTIGNQEITTEPDPEDGPLVAADGPAIKRFAAEFENPEGRPLMAIVLFVDAEGSDPGVPVEPLPFPVSYVIDASKPNASETMAAYRRAGHEVIALAPLPEGATPKDVEVAFQTYLAAVPEAVVVMDIPSAVFQSGRIVATQVAEALAASGHGMITYSRGLNSATQVAEREGVPVALVFREFDKSGQDGTAIKRFLDQAAFRAGQQSGVIMVGHNRAETVKALLEWGLGNRASTVALAPVSAALLAQ